MIRLLSAVSLILLAAACGDGTEPVETNSSQNTSIKNSIPLPTSILGKWSFQFNKDGATYQVWKIFPDRLDEIGVCKRGWSSKTDTVNSSIAVTEFTLSIQTDAPDNATIYCVASLSATVWNYAIIGSELHLTNSDNPEIKFIGKYLGPA